MQISIVCQGLLLFSLIFTADKELVSFFLVVQCLLQELQNLNRHTKIIIPYFDKSPHFGVGMMNPMNLRLVWSHLVVCLL